ncbi:MAG: DNA repair protein RecN [Gemmatimonadetes bacterium]|nr:DNA repair protein RecN [Gemmatimonadota bacterium]
MLAELRVRDLAVIVDARLELGPGLNVLTGETGAGKSMLVDALALLLGERAASDLVRAGAERAVVEGAFDLDGRDAVLKALEARGVEAEEDRLVLKREVQASGRSRGWVNGSPVTVGVLAEIGRQLVDLHGQHETQSLLHAEAQREILDSFGDACAEAAAVAGAFEARERLIAERRQLEARQAEARKRADYLRHVADEIARAAPKPGELDALDAEAKRLSHAEELGRTAEDLAQCLDGDERAASAALGHAARLIAALVRIDPTGAAGWREMLEVATLNLEELARTVRDYADAVQLDPARLAEVERRRDVLFRLDQKYGPGIDRILATGDEAGRELDLLDTAGTDLAGLSGRIEEVDRDFGERCRALSAKRRAAAKQLGASVTKQLAGLGMADGKFRVALEPLEQAGRRGAELIEFLVGLNPGMGERPMARVASGGELSRLMLALKVELARHDALPTLVFDEVDQGVGGHVAGRVADALARVAGDHQVLVITHLPQIAASASHHLVVSKASTDAAVQTHVQRVAGEERVEEIAKMLGAEETAATARKHARELLKAVRRPDRLTA